MKIFKTDGLECVLRIKKPESGSNGIDSVYIYELEIMGMGEIVWPNREGESFAVRDVYPVLAGEGLLDSGLSIAWPATASAMALMIAGENGDSVVFRLGKDPGGRHSEIRVYAGSADSIRICIAGFNEKWEMIKPAGAADFPGNLPQLQFQLGLIGPDGKTSAAGDKTAGFNIIPGLADRFINSFKPEVSPVFHLFGYGSGHDTGYPDYNPSPVLGGKGGLASAAEALHSKGFRLSCYLNARIAEESALPDFPLLQDGVCRNRDGSPVIEVYHGRRFNVMDPLYEPWLEHLYMQAMFLKDCGADAVQLDQVAGRAPVVPVGQPWGAGYRNLIERLRSNGLQVWIQGVSDYYPADWFEMTYRDLNILPGGVLRGGNPFGKTDLRLIKALIHNDSAAGDSSLNSASYLVPLEKARALAAKYGGLAKIGLPLIIDVLGAGGRLPVYGEDYLAEIAELEKTLLFMK